MGVEDRSVSRSEVARMLRPHVMPIAAIACAADRASVAMAKRMTPELRRLVFLRPKLRGQVTAALWTEGVREWVNEVGPPGVKLHTPYQWTELLVGDVLHVRIQKERYRPATPRRTARSAQRPDGTLPLWMQKGARVTNVDVNTIYSQVADTLTAVQIEAPLGRGFVWPPMRFGLDKARRQLASWERRDVPWLEVCHRAMEMAASVTALEQLRESGSALADVFGMPEPQVQPRATFTPKKRRDTGKDAQA